MGVEYDLISDSARVGYELGKGPWGDPEFAKALRMADPVAALSAFLVADDDCRWEADEIAKIVPEIVAFAAAHPDWRVIDDVSSDISVMSDEEIAEERAEKIAMGEDPDEFAEDLPRYRRVGSRYREVSENEMGTVVEEVAAEDRPPPVLMPDEEVAALCRKHFDADEFRAIVAKLPSYRPAEKVILYFEIDLAPGEEREVRPQRAVKFGRRDGKSWVGDVPIESVRPFRTRRFEPYSGWEIEKGVWFAAVRLGEGEQNDLVAEVPAQIVAESAAWLPTSPSAACVRFTVVNRGTEAVKFAGTIEGQTIQEETP